MCWRMKSPGACRSRNSQELFCRVETPSYLFLTPRSGNYTLYGWLHHILTSAEKNRIRESGQQNRCPFKKKRKTYSPRYFASIGRKVPASLTTPMACIVPRSISFVTDAGLMSTQMVFT